jgi:molybdate transport system ATP-binding protein
MIAIDINKNLHGSSGEFQLNVSLKIKEGEFLAIEGKSGSGKTTLLRILAGLEDAEGSIVVSQKVWLDKTEALPPQKRAIGFAFQEYALFENMTVLENLLFVQNDTALAEKLLEITDLTQLKNRYPKALSGGQKQRVSICRALMKRPKILLLDEPFSALDPTMRSKLQEELLKLHKEFGTTTIMVSHDRSDILRLASRVVSLKDGKIIQNEPQKLKKAKLVKIEESPTQKIATLSLEDELFELVLPKEL